MYNGAKVPSPQEGGANGVVQPAGPGASASATALRPVMGEGQPGQEADGEQEPIAEPVLVKKAHRQILDHDRKRRVELKCMELQEMMEEQGYTEEEIRQKVSTFRQMLMDKEGVITREGSHTEVHRLHYEHDAEQQGEPGSAEDCQEAECDHYHYDSDYRTKRKSSSSPSPRPKKKKKKKSGRRRTRFDSSSPSRREKKKKTGKKHKRDRSPSGSRRKRRHRSGSPKNKHKDRNRQRKRSPGDSPSRKSQRRGSCCSSRSASLSSAASTSKSPARPGSKHKADGHKAPTPPLPLALGGSAPWHNGHHSERAWNGKAGRLNHAEGDKGHNKLRALPSGSAGTPSNLLPPLREHQVHSAPHRSPAGHPGEAGEQWSGEGRQTGAGRSISQSSGKRGRQKGPTKTLRSPAHSSDSAHSQRNQSHRGKSSHQRKTKSGHSKRRHRSRGQGHHRSPSALSGHHRHASAKKKESRSGQKARQRSSSWSSGRSSEHSASRDRGTSKAKSPHSRERDSPTHSDGRRRSRSYSPIRKRRRDSPSFMEARRITSARKRPIPYYRPSPSSSSSMSSPSRSSPSRSRSYDSNSSYSRSRSRGRSRSRSYYSRSSDESPGF